MATTAAPALEPVRPPVGERLGALGWLKRNLFNSPLNSLLTLLILYFLWVTLVPLFEWAVLNAVWNANSKQECEAAFRAAGKEEPVRGACWAIVRARLGQYLYGLYPAEERWRVNLGFALLAVAMVPLFLDLRLNKLLYAAALILIYPPVAYTLFLGGSFGLPRVETHLWGGLFLTLVIAGVGITASLPLGVLLALGRRSEMPVIKALAVAFIELVRGVPLVTVLFMASVMLPLFLPEGVTFDKLLRALVGVSLFASAYMAEVVRGGLQAIPRGQYEAAAALGLGYWKMMGLVILPQALRLVIPGIVNTFIGLFKDTALVLIIGLYDLLGMAQIIIKDPAWLGLATETYLVAGAGFWIFCFGMSRYSMALERKLGVGQRR
ncbi:MAG: amino acid ABC transporter permease [Geminicoccaceae bacterium]|nr:amino acid ABC transporter permease [Geminicoccaceae bacterium]MDW8124075.1 amino acid ABC transporter permease [Geminicoccaceae bacterium]MDW8340262.1 amino acid ABC transporter permease [Geminicoccaceae bacterium]